MEDKISVAQLAMLLLQLLLGGLGGVIWWEIRTLRQTDGKLYALLNKQSEYFMKNIHQIEVALVKQDGRITHLEEERRSS